MSDYIKINVKDLREVQKRLKQLPKNVDKRVTVAATRAGATVLKKAAIKNIPVRDDGKLKRVTGKRSAGFRYPGYLRNNIGVRRVAKRFIYGVIFQVRPIRFAFYGKFLEEGTKHQARKPWLKPAFYSSRQSVANRIIEMMLRGIDRETKKLNRR